jgi:hypothetical protein
MSRPFTASSGTSTRRSLALGLAAIGAVVVLTSTGCRRPVFSPNEDRSQYDRFDQARDTRTQTLIEDEFGRKVPNLRKRLVHTE